MNCQKKIVAMGRDEMNQNIVDWNLQSELPIDFKISQVSEILDPSNKNLLDFGSQGNGIRRLVVIDRKVSTLYLNKVVEYLEFWKVEYHLVVIDAVEENKNLETLIYVLKEFEGFGLLRQSEPVIAIGGGVLLDIVGMASNLYRRGVPYIKVPTTLLAIVDASVGVKTGINFEDRRNRLGTYYPPVAAYLDKSFLKTLEPIEISAGLGEILKMAVVKDAKLFKILEAKGEELYSSKFLGSDSADEVISRSVVGMKEELQNNLWEKDLKRYVDFGHSFSPIPEMRSLEDHSVPSLTHGQAVTLDVLFCCVLSYNRGWLTKLEVKSVFKVAESVGLLAHHPYFSDAHILMEALVDTVKHRNGDQNLPLPLQIGNSTFVNDVTFSELQSAIPVMEMFSNGK